MSDETICFMRRNRKQSTCDQIPLKKFHISSKLPKFVHHHPYPEGVYKVNMTNLERKYSLKNIFFEDEMNSGEVIMGNILKPNGVYIIRGDSTDSENLDQSVHRSESKGRTIISYDPRMSFHFGRASHPEKPARLTKIWSMIEEEGLDQKCTIIQGDSVSHEDLCLVHTEQYISAIKHFGSNLVNDVSLPVPELKKTTDVYFNEYSAEAALSAVGSTIAVVEKVLFQGAQNGFALVRPPGHHAFSDKASGFCLFNNVAVAAKAAVNRMGLNRVLVVDWDVHHGNGTQDILYDDDRILFFSMHRHGGFYPGTGGVDEVGAETAKGKNVNIPFSNPQPYGDGDALYVWHSILMPIAREFQPELVLISAGFDAVEGDPLGQMKLTPQIFGHLIYQLEKEVNKGRIVLCLEGGYECDTVALCVSECLKVLMGESPTEIPKQYGSIEHNNIQPSPEHMEMYRQVLQVQSRYWKCLSPFP